MEQMTVQRAKKKEDARPNLTGIPTQMKLDFERRSELSFDDVRVHYNSDKPAQLRALAYTQGTQVHIGPGQERHLPHELGHVVQQKLGLVRPTVRIGNVPINDDPNLERGADTVGGTILKPGNAPVKVIQRFSILELLNDQQSPPKKWIGALLYELVKDSDKIKKNIDDLKQQHMNFNELNNVKKDPEATIYESIQAQLRILDPVKNEPDLTKDTEKPKDIEIPDDMKRAMQMGAVLNGISRMLAHKLGDMSATDQILDQLMEKLVLKPDSDQELAQLNKIKALAKSNPILMYLHDEINSHDAAIRLSEQNKLLGKENPETLELLQQEGSEETFKQFKKKGREETFELLKQQALMQIRAMNELQNKNKHNVSAAPTNRFFMNGTTGLYSISFLNEAETEIGNPEPFKASMDKLKQAFIDIDKNPQKKYREYPTIKKAERHQAREDRNPNESSVQERARSGVRKCIGQDFQNGNVTDEDIDRILDDIVSKLKAAPIMITRYADALLENELSEAKLHPSKEETKAGELVAGCPPAYITFDKLLSEVKHSPGQNHLNDISVRTTVPTEEKAKYISYTPLLKTGSKLAENRGITYPIFRSNKNRLFAGKTHQEKEAVFGTLCVAGARNHHQLWNYGEKVGIYGDVVLVFRPGTFKNYIITFGDRHRGYTDFKAFVYNAFAHKDEVKSTDPNIKSIKSDVLITKKEQEETQSVNVNLDVYLGRLIRLALDGREEKSELRDNDSFEFIEIQIFDPVQLTRGTISEVYFAGSVTDKQKNSIMKAISEAPVPSAEEHTSDETEYETEFFQYVEGSPRPYWGEKNDAFLYLCLWLALLLSQIFLGISGVWQVRSNE